MRIVAAITGLFLTVTLFAQDIKESDNLIASERFDDAFNLLTELQKKSPQNPYVYFALGETVLKSYINDPYSDSKNNIIKKAKSYFVAGLETDTLNPLNYVGLGILELYTTNDTVSADYYFSKAYKLIPTKKKKINDLHLKTLLKLETAELYSNSPRFYKSDFYYKRLIELRPKLPELYIGYGDVLMVQSNASEAIAQYKKALFLENTALTNVLVAKIYYLARNNDEAIKYYESALKSDSLFATAYKGMGNVYYKLNKHEQAKINYARFLELTGNNLPAKINYVKALYKAKDYDGTVSNTEDILKIDSSKTYLYRLVAYSLADKPNPDMARAEEYIQNFFSKAKEDEIIVKDYNYYSKILLSLKRDSNDIRKGVEMLEKAYLTDTTDNDALVDLIKTSYHYRLYDVEIKYLSKKINDGDNTSGNYSLLGKAFYYNKDFVRADSIFSKILTQDSLNVEAWQWKAYSLSSLDPDLKEGLAKPTFEKLLSITQNDQKQYLKERYEAYSYLGSFYMFSTIDYNKAIEYVKTGLELDPGNKQWQLKGYYTLAFAYYKSKQWLNAKSAYETVLKLKPDDTNAPKALKDINKFLQESSN